MQYVALQSWADAFEAVIPRRKFQSGKKARRGKSGAGDEESKIGEEEGEGMEEDDLEDGADAEVVEEEKEDDGDTARDV